MRGGEREILIGRAPDCDLSINDKLLSKVQCHIKCIFDPLSSN
jgi:predicted component of type VI protein secretion system